MPVRNGSTANSYGNILFSSHWYASWLKFWFCGFGKIQHQKREQSIVFSYATQ